MIRADHITVDGDTAWYVPTQDNVVGDLNVTHIRLHDRPCDTCEDWFRNGDGTIHSLGKRHPACDGTGRHTFEIEVRDHWAGSLESVPTDWSDTSALRVHVLEVLPIVGDDDDWKAPCIEIASEGNPPGLFTEDGYYVCNVPLPPVAKAGMWAVRLAVHS